MIRLVHWLVHLKLNVLMYQSVELGITSYTAQCPNVLKTLVQMYQSNVRFSLVYKGFIDVLIALVHPSHLFRGKERTFPSSLISEGALNNYFIKLYFVLLLTKSKMYTLMNVVTLPLRLKANHISFVIATGATMWLKLNFKAQTSGQCPVNDLLTHNHSEWFCMVVSWHWLFPFQNQETQQEQKELL